MSGTPYTAVATHTGAGMTLTPVKVVITVNRTHPVAMEAIRIHREVTPNNPSLQHPTTTKPTWTMVTLRRPWTTQRTGL